jgi:hypothetical protein
MVDFGFKVWNTENSIQIDSLYKNYVVYQQGTVTTANGFKNITFSSPTTYDVFVALQAHADIAVFSWGPLISAGQTTGWRVLADGVKSVKWVAYIDADAQTVTDDYGVIVYDAAGDMVWNSQFEYCKVRALYEDIPTSVSQWSSNGNCGFEYNHDNQPVANADDNYFYFTGKAMAFIACGGLLSYYTLGWQKVDSTSLTMEPIKFFSKGYGAGSINASFSVSPHFLSEFIALL